jgi:hypothetical protein
MAAGRALDLRSSFLRAIRQTEGFMRCLADILVTFLLPIPAVSVGLFRYRGAAKDGGTLEYIFEAGEQNSPNAVTKEKAAQIAADFMTAFYHTHRSARWRLRNLRQPPFRFGSSAFRTRLKDRCGKCSLSFSCRTGRSLCQAWRSGFNRWSVMRSRRWTVSSAQGLTER